MSDEEHVVPSFLFICVGGCNVLLATAFLCCSTFVEPQGLLPLKLTFTICSENALPTQLLTWQWQREYFGSIFAGLVDCLLEGGVQ